MKNNSQEAPSALPMLVILIGFVFRGRLKYEFFFEEAAFFRRGFSPTPPLPPPF